MDFGLRDLDADAQAFADEVRTFFETHVTDEVLELELEHGDGFHEGVHLAMAARGWVTPTWPTEAGGAGLDALRLAILHSELDRSRLSISLSSTTDLPVLVVREHAEPTLRDEVLAGVAAGTVRICLGYTEPDCGSDLAAVRTRAVRDGDGWRITGQKMFTTGAQASQYCFLLARTDPDVPKHRGLTTFLVPMDLPGIEVTPIRTLGGERTNFLHLDDVRLTDRFRLGPVDGGWGVMSAPLAAEHGRSEDAGRPVGTGSRSFALEVARVVEELLPWLRSTDRHGRAPIDDPVVRSRLARIAIDVEAARSTPGTMGRVIASDVARRAMSDLLDLVGPVGVLGRGAPGSIGDGAAEGGLRYAPGTAIYGGTSEVHRNVVAEQTLGLPRSTPRG